MGLIGVAASRARETDDNPAIEVPARRLPINFLLEFLLFMIAVVLVKYLLTIEKYKEK
jgi:hypothetical protein